jgi:hypothetical protein
LPDEGTASEDGGWQCKISKTSVAEQGDQSSWVSDICVFEGQFSATGGQPRWTGDGNAKHLDHHLQSRGTVMGFRCPRIRRPMLCQRRGQPRRTGDCNAKHLNHRPQSSVLCDHHGLQLSAYSRTNALPEEGTASEDGG